MTKVTDDPLPFLPFTETVDPSNPAAGGQRLFVDTDHLLKMVDSSGTVTTFSSSGGAAVATDAIWDAAGDLLVGTGANTGARLALGNAGGYLSRVNGAVAWNSGTSFPTAATGDRYWRTDLGMEFFYDGTRWLSIQTFKSQFIPRESAGVHNSGDITSSVAATAGTSRAGVPSVLGCSDIYIVSHHIVFRVNSGGTALGASHKWVGTVVPVDLNDASLTVVATHNIDSGSSGVFRQATVSIGAVMQSGTFYWQNTWTKTGTPGNLVVIETIYYRIIAT